MTAADAYRTLNLAPGASAPEIRQAYLDLVKVWHPDRFEHDERLRQKAATHLAEINEAYAVLRGAPAVDVETRAAAPETPPSPGVSKQPVASNGRHVAVAAVMAASALVAIGVILTKAGAPQSTAVNPGTVAEDTASSAANMAVVDASPRTAPGDAPSSRPASEPVRPPDDRSPESGTDVRPFTVRGHAPLSLTNEAGSDALVLLSNEAAGPPDTQDATRARAIFVRRGEKVTLLDFAPGDYRVRFVLGSEWNGRTFARPSAHFARSSTLTLADGPPAVAAGLALTRSGDFQPIAPFTID